ncbi:MAG: hypothetical protein P9X22_01050 [Candidatus Zapsychrus exili]|nr:hypothetical protein [Candidatus Zapsychrus exili]
MKKIILLFLCFVLVGCMSVSVPNYIKDDYPYKKVFYSDFDTTLNVTEQSLRDLGWEITDKVEPTIFEKAKELQDSNHKQILLFTETKETLMFIGTRYSRVNVYLRSGENNTTGVEVRYFSLTAVPFKNFSGYRKDGLVSKLFERIKNYLDYKSPAK